MFSLQVKSQPSLPTAQAGFGSVVHVEAKAIMTYQQRLKYWAIARLLPSEQWIIIARFYSRSDAEGHFQFLSRNLPSASFRVVFDVLDE